MEEQDNENMSTLYQEVDYNNTFSNMVKVQTDDVGSMISDMYGKPHLALQEICTLEGNKNKTGFLEGLHCQKWS